MEELIACIARSLVKNPMRLQLPRFKKKGLEVYQLHVAPEDMGKVIGKQGKIAKALRLVVKAAAVKANKKVSVDIV